MADYIVSARKYRPESFETLVGQDNIAKTLNNSIQRGQLAHAYLFCGPRGVGKTTTARIFAKMINCSNPKPNGDPCGECESCVSFAEGRSYCIYEMDAASNNSVEDIKDLIDKVRIPPQVGKYSVYIIDEVHMLSTQAFNAFLKTLEEPPEYAVFILATTEKHKILPTILSRCQTYDFNRITVDNIVRNLRDIASKENITIDDDSLHVIAQKADGAMRDALTIFDQTVAFCGTDVKYSDVTKNLNVLDYEYTFSLVRNFLSGDYATALRSFDEILSKGFNALHFMSALSSHLRDLLVAKAGGIDSLMELSDSLKENYRAQAAQCSEKFLYDALSLTMACEQTYKAAVNQRLHIEFCLMKLSFLNKAAAPAPIQAPAPAPAQAPAPVQAPAQSQPAEPQIRHRAVTGTSALSLKAMSAQNDKPAEQALQPENDIVPEDEAIREGWKKLCEASSANLRLFNALLTAQLTIEEGEGKKVVRYAVLNESLKSWLDTKNSRIEGKLRDLLSTSKVDLVLELMPEDPSQKMVVSPEEKAREMMAQNPEIKEWITALGLEIK